MTPPSMRSAVTTFDFFKFTPVKNDDNAVCAGLFTGFLNEDVFFEKLILKPPDDIVLFQPTRQSTFVDFLKLKTSILGHFFTKILV